MLAVLVGLLTLLALGVGLFLLFPVWFYYYDIWIQYWDDKRVARRRKRARQ